MMNKTLWFITIICSLVALASCNKEPEGHSGKDKKDDGPIVLEEMPFKKAVNLGDWFLQVDESYLTKQKYSEKDFRNIQSLGFEAVRLPIRFQKFTGPEPAYVLSKHFFEILDYAVDLAEKTGLYIILDNHSYFGADVFPTAYGQAQLIRVWQQMAAHFKDRSDKVIYEVMNEPGGDYMDKNWYDIQTVFLQTIRAIDKKHTVIVKGVGDSRSNLVNIPAYEDKNLIYSFHFYGPSIFTHQGAKWQANNPTLTLDKPIPFPYSEARMPAKTSAFPSDTRGEYHDYDSYKEQGTEEWVKGCLDVAIEFSKKKNVPVFCGEFGVVRGMALSKDRAIWAETVSTYLEKNGIGWAYWDWNTDFSMFNGNPIFDQNLDIPLIEALGLKTPPSYLSGEAPEILLYDDVLASFAKNSSWNGSESDINSFYSVNYECTADPYEGSNCIEWEVAYKWGSLEFTFWPVADFSAQYESDYALEFMIRCAEPVNTLHVRLCYYKDADTRAWRNTQFIGNADKYANFASDGQWHKISIPLQDLYIKGNNDTDKFVDDYEAYVEKYPEQAWDWQHINRVTFAAEGNTSLVGNKIYIDEVRICKK